MAFLHIFPADLFQLLALMPLYMDFHKFAGVTIEEVKKAHMADLAVQEKYGVKYHQFWVNQEAGTIFCLTEGPDMETCEMVHRLAHGNVACAMTEVEPGYYKVFMGEGHRIDHGIVRNNDGSMDQGYRSILAVLVQPVTTPDAATRQLSNSAGQLVVQKFNEFNGRQLLRSADERYIGVFNDVTRAVACARNIRNGLLDHYPGVLFRAGLSTGQPVTEDGQFFTKALAVASRLSAIAREKQVLLCSLTAVLRGAEDVAGDDPSISALTSSEEEFATSLMVVAEGNLSSETFTIDSLCRELGVSRPRLYRKVTSLTGRSPNDLLKDLRMERALTLLKRKTGNISEIALEVGYSNPSYFARCFARKFGCSPSMLQR